MSKPCAWPRTGQRTSGHRGERPQVLSAAARPGGGGDLVVFPEMVLPATAGGPAAAGFLRGGEPRAWREVAGFPRRDGRGRIRRPGREGACVQRGRIAATGASGRLPQDYLPNYGVFDEMRYFRRGTGRWFARWRRPRRITICEDIWVRRDRLRGRRRGANLISYLGVAIPRGKWEEPDLVAAHATADRPAVRIANGGARTNCLRRGASW